MILLLYHKNHLSLLDLNLRRQLGLVRELFLQSLDRIAELLLNLI